MIDNKFRTEIVKIPNIMTAFRIFIIPFFVWSYSSGHNYLASAILCVSALSDIVDGYIARKFNMITDTGKILDPAADIFTQLTLIICLLKKHEWMKYLIILYITFKVVITVLGYISIRRTGKVYGASWYGKACTVILEASMMSFIIFENIPDLLMSCLIAVCCFSIISALLLYIIKYIKILSGNNIDAADNNITGK